MPALFSWLWLVLCIVSLASCSMWGLEGGSLTVPSVHSSWKITYSPHGRSSGVTLSGCLAEQKTSRYGDSILKLLQHLLTTYNHITPQQQNAKEIYNCNIQFNKKNAVDDLLKMSVYALMLISSSLAVNLANVVFAKNPILLQDLQACNCHSAEFSTWDAMKIHLRKAQHDLISLPVTGQIYNQELQKANN